MDLENYTNRSSFTMEERCMLISKFLKEKYNQDIEPKAIWDAMPNGELYPIFEKFEAACRYYRVGLFSE